MFNIHSFSVEEAEKYGADEAIMIQSFRSWIGFNRANGVHQHDGKTWTFNSAKSLSELFPYWEDYQVRRIIQSLIKQGVLITGNYNPTPHDRTTWYAFSDENLFLDDGPNPHFTKSSNPFEENDKSISRNRQIHLRKSSNGENQQLTEQNAENTRCNDCGTKGAIVDSSKSLLKAKALSPPKAPPLKAKDAEKFLPPSWVPSEEWDAFDEVRQQNNSRKPWTLQAKKMIVSKLERLKAQGYDPATVLAESVMNGWTGVFPYRNAPTNSPSKPKEPELTEAQRRENQRKDQELRDKNILWGDEGDLSLSGYGLR